MKKIVVLFVLGSIMCCKSQSPVTKDLSGKKVHMNYIFSQIIMGQIQQKVLYNQGLYVKIFLLTDFKATPDDFSEGHEVLLSFIVSVRSDTDNSTNTKLYKIEGLINPEILNISETKFPNFSIRLEHGLPENRDIETFEFEGVQ